MRDRPEVASNLELLERFWRRSGFHDYEIEQVSAINRRVIIRLTHMTLIVTGATDLERCELPTAWFSESVSQVKKQLTLKVVTETGTLKVVGADIRLIRNNDLAVLIPPIDVKLHLGDFPGNYF